MSDTIYELAFKDGPEGPWRVFGYFDSPFEAERRAESAYLFIYQIREVLA